MGDRTTKFDNYRAITNSDVSIVPPMDTEGVEELNSYIDYNNQKKADNSNSFADVTTVTYSVNNKTVQEIDIIINKIWAEFDFRHYSRPHRNPSDILLNKTQNQNSSWKFLIHEKMLDHAIKQYLHNSLKVEKKSDEK